MRVFDMIVVNIIYIVFPILCYLFYNSYNEVFSKKDNSIFLELALCTSIYLCIKFDNSYIMLYNIPLLISYKKNKNIFTIILSFIIGYYMITFYKYSLIFILIEYLSYYILFLLKSKTKFINKYFSSCFIIINMVFKIINSIYFNKVNLVDIILFPIITYIIMYCLKKSEAISNIHMSSKQLEKEKQIRNSLFKITHEIKNPLAVCKGYLDMFDKNNPKHVNKYIPIIQNEIDRTLTIMSDFMEFSKIKLNLDIMDIEMLLEEVLDSLNSLLNNKSIKLNYKIIGNEIFINGDYNRLKQVFINILKNSMEALENISNGKIDIEYTVNDKNVMIIISDNGIGMDNETLSKIYEAFYTTKRYGTGLGVNLSKEIIEGHKGKIKYYSELNKGTSVKITLPITNV